MKLIAFYLPQYYPTPENDKYWGKGFTDWYTVAKAKPLYKKHRQPKLPGYLGFYDLRVPEVREEQALLAESYGITGFAYWHYWFSKDKITLERPLQEVVRLKSPNLPFCIAWANHSWSKAWVGQDDIVFFRQEYPGISDYIAHFYAMLPTFQDERYIRVQNKLLVIVYAPHRLPEPRVYTDLWNELAIKEGFDGVYFVGITYKLSWEPTEDGFDAKTVHVPWFYRECYGNLSRFANYTQRLKAISSGLTNRPLTYDYRTLIERANFLNFGEQYDLIPCVIPRWDNTPRYGKKGYVFKNSTPAYFMENLQSAVDFVKLKQHSDPIIFIKSWNEWAEGNFLEPDDEWGEAYLASILKIRELNQ